MNDAFIDAILAAPDDDAPRPPALEDLSFVYTSEAIALGALGRDFTLKGCSFARRSSSVNSSLRR